MSTLTDNDKKSKIDRGYEQGSGSYNPQSFQDLEQQSAYDRDFDKIIKDEEAAGGWKTDISSDSPKKKITGKAWFQKKGPLSAIFALIVGGGAGLTMLGSPALLIVHFKEIMVEKFNTQLASMDVGTTRMMSAKITGMTGGHCGDKITIRCKFTSMSKGENGLVTRLEREGIKINPSSKTTLTGRVIPESFEFKDKVITAQNFDKEIIGNREFKNAVKRAHNANYASLTGKGWGFTARKWILRKSDPFEGAKNDEDRQRMLNESTKNGQKEALRTPSENEKNPKTGQNYTSSEIEAIKAENLRIEAEINDTTGPRANTLQEIDNGVKGISSGVVNAVKIDGTVNIACDAYNSIRMLGYMAKTVRAVQLARYALTFLTVADMIKSGDAKPEDVAYVGGILTEVSYDATSAARRIKKASATDSAGFKYAAYGDTSGFTKSNMLSQFMAGGGLTGELINATNAINEATNGNVKTACDTVKNPIVQTGSFIGGVVLLFTGVGTVGQAVKAGVGATLQISLSLAMTALPDLLKGIVAGDVTRDIFGEDSGDAISSGSGSMFSQVGAANGIPAMKKDDAQAYINLQNQTLARYAQEDREELSPFDMTNKNTFMGSIVSQLIPYNTSFATPSTALSSLGLFIGDSFSSLIPTSSALTDAQQTASLNSCTDPDYVEMDIATDPFCNVIRGMPPRYLNKDPIEVTNEMGGQIDETTGEPTPGSEYESYIKNCMLRDEPLGSEENGATSGKECVVNDNNAKYYAFYMYNTISDSMDNGYDYDPNSTSTEEGATGPGENSGNIKDNGWAWPSTAGSTGCGFGCYAGHTGMDIAVGSGSPFYAARDGVVRSAGPDQYMTSQAVCSAATTGIIGGVRMNGTQYTIVIDHQINGKTITTVYTHITEGTMLVKAGDTVKAGDLIAKTGGSGCSTAPHAHFGIYEAFPNKPIDPITILGSSG